MNTLSNNKLNDGFRAFRVRNYRLYWIGQLISFCGTWMQTTAQAWVVYDLTQSPFALGLVSTLQFLPIMLLTLFGGVIADRVPKRKVVLITQTLALIQAGIFGLLVSTGQAQIGHVYVLAAIQGIINAIDNPVRQSFANELVSNADRPSAIALNSVLFNTARVLGPALAGILIASIGTAAALYLNAASFLAVITAVLLMNPAEFVAKPSARKAAAPLRELAEGLKYAWNTPAILTPLIIVAAVGTFGYNFSVVLPLVGGFVLKTDAAGFGALSSAFGVGSLVGALVNTLNSKESTARLMWGSIGFSVLLAALPFSTNLQLSMLLLVLQGLCGVTFTTAASTVIQTTVPDQLRGRITSLNFLLFAGSTPIGALVIGTLSDMLNVPDALLICAILCLIGIGISAMYHRRAQATGQPSG
ncbi:MAG: MFS transporter [Anaerolineae bacterium]|nr:MFS transporter [Anaerolineae bacterium]